MIGAPTAAWESASSLLAFVATLLRSSVQTLTAASSRLDPAGRTVCDFSLLHTARRSSRRGFTLLEVIVAVAILVVSLTLLVEIQSSAVKMTVDAERFVTATNLAQEKMTEVRLRMEEEGFYEEQEIEEDGDFDDFGDEAVDLEFGDALENYHWRYSVVEIDLGMASDIADMAEGYGDDEEDAGGLGLGGAMPGSDAASTGGENQPGLNDLGVSNDLISEELAKYIRHVEVEVWWGDNYDKAVERKDHVLITGHITNPTGAYQRIPDGGGT